MKRFTSSLMQPLKNSRGSAIMFSMFVLSLLMFIAMEVSKDTVVEYQGSSNNIKRVQAYYAAKSCTDLSLLRIKAFQQASAALAKQIPDPSMLDMIWTFPLSWPIVAPSGVSESDKDSIKKVVDTSTIKHQFSSKITAESRKIDVNDLASSSEGIREKTKQQILDFFKVKLQDGSDFSKKYANFRFENLIMHMADWIDADSNSQLGGDEGSYYSDRRSLFIPPNQAFKTIEELHMVRDMEDEIFEVLAPIITIYGAKGININYAEKEMLMGLDRRITSEYADQIIKRRSDPSQGGLFKDKKDFMGFIAQYGIGENEFDEAKVPLYFDQEVNFTISCIGAVGRITREITTQVFDFRNIQERLVENYATDTDPNKKQCAELQGDDKYKCLCADKTDPAENKKCIDTEKANDTNKKPDQGQTQAPEPGPPYIIFQDVK